MENSSPPDTGRPSNLGCYRIDAPLGKGGMGEVYLGQDTEKDRPVALKRIKTDRVISPDARERFRREARALARIDHDGVVKIYDRIEEEDGDWLVMELVEGQSLKNLMEEGRLTLLYAVEIARDLAAGLVEIHHQGIVHRDLKPDNIMVPSEPTSSLVKILDFGLAKRIRSQDGVTLTESISRQGQILGTIRYMSPEQALGHRVDPQSDLFSLGVILYEMLTGVSPFAGANDVETLTRICTQREVPVEEHQASIPSAISKFLWWILEKNPDHRPKTSIEVEKVLRELAEGIAAGGSEKSLVAVLPPIKRRAQASTIAGTLDPGIRPEVTIQDLRNSEEVVGATGQGTGEVLGDAKASGRLFGWKLSAALAMLLILTVLAGIGAVQIWQMREAPPPRYVAVPPTEIIAENPEALRLKASVIQSGLIHELQGYEGVAPVEPRGSTAEIEDPAEMALAMGAQEVLLSTLECASETCQIFLERVSGVNDDGVSNGASGSVYSVVWNHRFLDPTAELRDLDILTGEQLRNGFLDFEVRDGVPELSVLPEDYDAFWEIQEGFIRREEGMDAEAALAALRAIRTSSPNFTRSYFLEARILKNRFFSTRNSSDLEAALAVSGAVLEIAPGLPQAWWEIARIQIEAGRLDQAEESLGRARAVAPGEAHVYAAQAMLQERRGNGEEALGLMHKAVERLRSDRLYSDLSDMEYRLGKLEDARKSLERSIEINPYNYDTLSRLAVMELLDGSLEEAVVLFERLVEKVPEYAELSNLGTTYLLLERYEDAVHAFKRALESAPASPQALLNLADAYLLTGQGEPAKIHYEKTVEATLEDADPEALLTVQAQALAHLERFEEAIAAVQEALRLQPENPQVIYEAALVYSIVGEEVSALLYAKQAIELGVGERWFDFSWFDAIRSELDS